MAGQGIILALNLVTGFLILRYLPISEYALYTVASVLLSIGNVGSDMGLSQGIITFGARLKDDKHKLSSMYITAVGYRRWLYLITTVVVAGLAPFMMGGHHWQALNIAICVLIVLITNWIQQTFSLRNSILNVFHDSTGLTQIGLLSALLRLTLTIMFCRILPIAVVALAVNLAGLIIGSRLLRNRCMIYISDEASPSVEQGQALKEFVYPLVPGVIYFLLQGQISTAILSLFGYTSSVAEIGALGRLGQVLGLFMMLNGFFVQPHFAQIRHRKEFIKKASLVISGVALLSFIIMASALILPEWWLFILGPKYAGLKMELPIGLLGSLLYFFMGTLYTMSIARKSTEGQSWMIAAGISIQILFIGMHGVRTTFDAVLLNTFLAGGGMMLQAFLLSRVIYSWREN